MRGAASRLAPLTALSLQRPLQVPEQIQEPGPLLIPLQLEVLQVIRLLLALQVTFLLTLLLALQVQVKSGACTQCPQGSRAPC